MEAAMMSTAGAPLFEVDVVVILEGLSRGE